MGFKNKTVTLESVLDLFQMEEIHDGDVLARYVQAYPQFALQLIDLSRLIATPDVEDESPLSATEQSRIDAAWIAHKAAGPQAPLAGDPLALLTGERSKALALKLGVPRQVITCFRERKVEASSVPGHVCQEFAEALEIPAAHVIAAMRHSPNWQKLPADMKESLEMVALKIGRILNGNPSYIDSWTDAVGYAQLVVDRLERGQNAPGHVNEPHQTENGN